MSLASYDTNNLWYASGCQSALDQYKRSKDWNAYLADCAYLSIRYLVDQQAMRTPGLRYAAASMTALQHVIRSAIEVEIEKVRAPDMQRESLHDYVDHLKHHTAHHIARHCERFDVSLQRGLRHIGLA